MQRSPHDKDYVQQCIKQLHKFLLGLGFPETVTVKDIQPKPLEDFKKVTESINAFVELSFQIPTNEFDEETLKMLKDLGYWYPSTSSMAPNARVVVWLAWLCDWIMKWYSDKPLTICLCDAIMERAGRSEEKDEAFQHLVTVISLANWLQNKLEISCSSEAHKAAPEKELEEVENIRVFLERQKLIASNECYTRKSDEMEQKIQKLAADNERSNREADELQQRIKEWQQKPDSERSDREKDELRQTLQRLKQSIEENEQMARN